MIELQNELEIKIAGANWIELGYDYDLAFAMECAELIDHMPWKWWSATEEIDKYGMLGELIDMLHFIIADCIVRAEGDLEHAQKLLDGYLAVTKSDSFIKLVPLVKHMMGVAANSGARFTGPHYMLLCERMNVSREDLRRYYEAKWCVNQLRQNYGYATGTYKKVWMDGREDTAHAFQLADSVIFSEINEFYELLENSYIAHS